MINRHGAITIAFFVGALCAWLLLTLTKETQNTEKAPFNSSFTKQEYSAEHIALQNKVIHLEGENDRLVAALNSMKLISRQDEPDPKDKMVELSSIRQELITYKLNEISTNLKDKIGNNLDTYAAKITDDFNNEKKDVFWSEQEEIKLRTAINQDAELSHIAIRDIECKTSQCKISVFSGNAEQNQEIFEKLTRSISKLYQNPSYYSNPLESNGIKTIYFKIM
jgi:ribosomal protein S17E